MNTSHPNYIDESHSAPPSVIAARGRLMRNKSNEIFSFGGSHGFEHPIERYDNDVIAAEKLRRKHVSEQYKQRWEIQNNLKEGFEKQRWIKMSEEFQRQNSILETKIKKSRYGRSSVDYNPISLEYRPGDAGEKLKVADDVSMHRTAVRAAKLYFKQNTFDPIKGKDIPVPLVPTSLPLEQALPFPKYLISETERTAQQLAEKLHIEKPKPVLDSNYPLPGVVDMDYSSTGTGGAGCSYGQAYWAKRY